MKQPNRRFNLVMIFTVVLGITVAWPVFAESSDGQRKRRGPPTVAIEACTNAAVGDACNFVGRRDNELTGVCESRREMVVCVPEGHRERRGRGGDDASEIEPEPEADA